MKALFLGVVLGCGLWTGCGSSDLDETAAVEDISTDDQVSLCEQFLDDICPQQLGASFCADECVMSACRPAAENGNIDEQCDQDITVQNVEDCGTSGDNNICVSERGGCMFAALDAACAQ